MARNSSLILDEDMIRDEYEIMLYGFCIKEFVKENFLFVDLKIKSAMRDLNKNFIDQVKDIKPETRKNIVRLGNSAADEISKSSKKNVAKVNDVIIESFSIPENVLLYCDRLHASDVSLKDREALKTECEFLEQTAKENAFFINALEYEIDLLDYIIETSEDVSIRVAEEYLNNTLDAELLQHTMKKISKFE